MESKTNISVKNTLGQRVTSNMQLGDSNGFASGDILDANATVKVIKDSVAEIVGTAPEDLDTIAEVAEKIQDLDIDTKTLPTGHTAATIGNAVVFENDVKIEGGQLEVDGDVFVENGDFTVDATSFEINGGKSSIAGGDLQLQISGGTNGTRVYGPVTLDNRIDYAGNLVSTIYIDESNNKVTITGDIACGMSNGEPKRKQEPDSNMLILDLKDPKKNVISWIRLNTKVYQCYYNGHDDILWCDPRTDKDNDRITTVIQDHPQLRFVGSFIKLPQFWYRCTRDAKTRIVRLDFTHDYSIIDSSWNEWDGNQFIGRYLASSETMESVATESGVNPIFFGSYKDAQDAATNIGKGFSVLTYNMHKILEILFYATYGVADSSNVLASGDPAYMLEFPYKTKYILFNDWLDYSKDLMDRIGVNSFMGVVSHVTEEGEFICGIHSPSAEMQGNDCSVWITEGIDGGRYFEISHNAVGGIVTSKAWNKYADVLPIQSSGDIKNDAGYATIFPIAGGDGTAGWETIGNLGMCTSDTPDCYARLCYCGAWVDLDHSNAFDLYSTENVRSKTDEAIAAAINDLNIKITQLELRVDNLTNS